MRSGSHHSSPFTSLSQSAEGCASSPALARHWTSPLIPSTAVLPGCERGGLKSGRMSGSADEAGGSGFKAGPRDERRGSVSGLGPWHRFLCVNRAAYSASRRRRKLCDLSELAPSLRMLCVTDATHKPKWVSESQRGEFCVTSVTCLVAERLSISPPKTMKTRGLWRACAFAEMSYASDLTHNQQGSTTPEGS